MLVLKPDSTGRSDLQIHGFDGIRDSSPQIGRHVVLEQDFHSCTRLLRRIYAHCFDCIYTQFEGDVVSNQDFNNNTRLLCRVYSHCFDCIHTQFEKVVNMNQDFHNWTGLLCKIHVHCFDCIHAKFGRDVVMDQDFPGDIRLLYTIYNTTEASVLAQQSGATTFSPWKGPYDHAYTM